MMFQIIEEEKELCNELFNGNGINLDYDEWTKKNDRLGQIQKLWIPSKLEMIKMVRSIVN